MLFDEFDILRPIYTIDNMGVLIESLIPYTYIDCSLSLAIRALYFTLSDEGGDGNRESSGDFFISLPSTSLPDRGFFGILGFALSALFALAFLVIVTLHNRGASLFSYYGRVSFLLQKIPPRLICCHSCASFDEYFDKSEPRFNGKFAESQLG